MRRAINAWCVATALALSVVGPGALVAAGDDGPSHPFPTDHPTRTILRPTEIVRRDPPPSDKTVVMLVAGIGSDASDGTFDALVAALSADPKYELHRFGGEPEYPYDTRGSIDESADHLTAEIRDLARTHPKIDIVAHSMGGVVVDTAFRRGLSVNDKVDTYIALASPHDGSTEARVAQPFLAAADLLGATAEFRAITGAVAQDVGSRAVEDLARAHAGPPPAGIKRFDLRFATDVIVTAPDARDPGVTSRVMLPRTPTSVEGHGGVTTDPRAIELVTSSIASGHPPAPDWRDRALWMATDAVSTAISSSALPLYCGLLATALVCATCLAIYRRRRALGIP